MDIKQVNEKLNAALRCFLSPDFTAASYAVMVDGEFIASDSIGSTGGKNPRPVSGYNTYNVGSCTKVYTSVAVMQLVEQGRLDLDTPVVKYLPEFKTMNDGYQRITLRQCLSHSSGLPGTQWNMFAVPKPKFTEKDFKKAALDYFSHSMLKAQPGEYSVYCNDGFTLAELCVAEVSDEKDFGLYCRKHITDPIGAYSSRICTEVNPDYSVVSLKSFPPELLYARGAGGLTTTMEHMALFGNEFLKPDSKMLTAESKNEINKVQTIPILKSDTARQGGLGWDNVRWSHPFCDLGEDVLTKNGGTMHFGSRLTVIPKYNAVVAFSHTFDGNADVSEASVLLLSLALLYVKGVNITKYKPVPEKTLKKYSGAYVNATDCFVPDFFGPFCFLMSEDGLGRKTRFMNMLGFTGARFRSLDGKAIRFDSSGPNSYLMMIEQGMASPIAQLAADGEKLSESWEKRLGKKYVNISFPPDDEGVYTLNSGFKLERFRDSQGILKAIFPCGSLAGTQMLGMPLKSVDDHTATCFYASRDCTTLQFYEENKVEYCIGSSYVFRDCAGLPSYRGQGFKKAGKEAAAYRIVKALEQLPEIPAGRRAIVLDEDLAVVYDSLMSDAPFIQAGPGYILLS